MLRTKPKTPEEFISLAKDSRIEEFDLSDLEIKKDKTFLLRMPPKLHELAKKKAEESKIPLHDYILLTIKERVLGQ